MVARVIFSLLVTLFIAQLVLADPTQCPNKYDADELAWREEVHENAPSSGTTVKSYTSKSINKTISCITITAGYFGTEQNGSISVAAVGLTSDTVAVTLVSNTEKAMDVEVEVYTKTT